MTTVIDLSEVIVDDWVRYDRFRALGGVRRVLVSFEDLGRYPRYFERSLFQLGVELEADVPIDDIAGWLPRLDLISLNFAVFADGRPFSQAKLLRDRFGYRGDIRAHGEVLRDQLSFMQRCGINQFSLAEGEDVELALGAFADISESYQPELVQLEIGKAANG
jgi:uncharacterized protein (DUF934 family)